MKFAIIGSCVTRDFFEWGLPDTTDTQVGLYLSRATALSMVSPPLPEQLFQKPDASMLTGFDARRFLHDLNKQHLTLLEQSDWDALILDFIDERFPIYEYGGGVVTGTQSAMPYLWPLLERGVGQLHAVFGRKHLARSLEAVGTLARFIRRIGGRRPVFLHAARCATHYLSGDRRIPFPDHQQKVIRALNNYLENLHARFLAGSEFIKLEVKADTVVAGGDCKWGLAPFHYDRSYYLRFAEQFSTARHATV